MKTYKDGIKEGRRQIIRNLKRHYDEMYFGPPISYAPDCEIGVCLPESTLYKYFKEIKDEHIPER